MSHYEILSIEMPGRNRFAIRADCIVAIRAHRHHGTALIYLVGVDEPHELNVPYGEFLEKWQAALEALAKGGEA
jgi:hypothetical protein